jgi:hypothetical protein
MGFRSIRALLRTDRKGKGEGRKLYRQDFAVFPRFSALLTNGQHGQHGQQMPTDGNRWQQMVDDAIKEDLAAASLTTAV